MFTFFQSQYPTEYDCLGLGSTVACGGCLRGLMGATLAAWFPLRSPHAPITVLEKWSPLLSPKTMENIFWKPWYEQIQLASL